MKSGHTATQAISLSITVFAVHSVIIWLTGDLTSQSQWVTIIVTALVSAGAISLTTKAVVAGISKFSLVLKLVLGGEYTRGTWGGIIKTRGGRKLVFVERYEQTTLDLVIHGWSFEGNETKYDAWWVSKCVTVDSSGGQIQCLFETHIPGQKGSKEDIRYGTGRFVFTDRASANGPPVRMMGTAVNEFKETSLEYIDIVKLDSKLLDKEIARQMVIKQFGIPDDASGDEV